HKFSFWRKKGVKYIQPEIPFGNTKDIIFLKKTVAEKYKDFYDEYPNEPYVGLYELSTPSLLIRDPELIRHVMVKDFAHFQKEGSSTEIKCGAPLNEHLLNLTGSKWRSLRSKLSPTFTSGKMKLMFNLMLECVDQLKEYLDKYADNEETLEMKEVMSKFTTEVVGSCAFGLNFNAIKDENSEFRKMGRKIFEASITAPFKRFVRITFPFILKVLRISPISPELVNFFTGVVKDTIQYREKNNVVRNDFLQLLIELKHKGSIEYEDSSEINKNELYHEEINGKTKHMEIEFTDNLMASQAFVFFLAGFETSSTTLSFCLHELACNPDVQDKLRKCIRTTLNKYDGKITYESLQNMSYLDQVVDETLRKYPAGSTLGRVVTKPYQIPGSSLKLDVGDKVQISVYALHHDPKYFPHPERFNPDNFTPEAKAKRPNYTYLPFGDGPRNCIGMRFGLLQTKLGLAVLISNYEFSVCEKTEIPIRLDPKKIIISFTTGAWMKIKKCQTV
ncbi:hypothetical protein L9F63_004686, partial [Diploptera punctata]